MPPQKQIPNSKLWLKIKKTFIRPPYTKSPLENLAQETGLSRQIINAWLLGRVRPGFIQIEKLAGALEISVGAAHKMIKEIPLQRKQGSENVRNQSLQE